MLVTVTADHQMPQENAFGRQLHEEQAAPSQYWPSSFLVALHGLFVTVQIDDLLHITIHQVFIKLLIASTEYSLMPTRQVSRVLQMPALKQGIPNHPAK